MVAGCVIVCKCIVYPCSMKKLYHFMPREKICGALDSCFGLVGSLWF